MPGSPFIVAFGGTLRPNSSTERLLQAVLTEAHANGAETRLFGGPDIDFPMYQPGNASAKPEVSEFLDALRSADAIVIGSPGYHGGVSGLVKNAIDYTEEMAKDTPPYFSGKRVGCLGTAFDWQSCNATLQALRAIVHALHGWPTPAGIALSTQTPSFDAEGVCINQELKTQIKAMAEQLLARFA
jgi:FMN reductase